MSAVLRNRIFGLLCLCAMGMLFVHSAQAVLFPDEAAACEAAAGHAHDASEDDCSSSPGCCHGHCPTMFMEFAPPASAIARAFQGVIRISDESAPDAPAREIDLPPQLS